MVLRVKSFIPILFPLFFLFLLNSSLVTAEPTPGKKFGDWLHECEAAGEGEPICALTQAVPTSDGKGTLLKLTIRKLGKEQVPILVALVPLGIYLPSGIVAMVDNGPQFSLVVQTCTVQGCEAFIPQNPKELWRLKAGKKLLIGFKAKRGPSTVTVPVSLEGVSEGLLALGWKGW